MIHGGITAEQYHADPAPDASLSSSIAKILLDQSPMHAWMAHPRLNPNYKPDENARFDLGSAAHMLILEKRIDGIVIIEAKDWKTKLAKEQRDAARANGQFPVLRYQFEKMEAMAIAANQYLETTELVGILENGSIEETFIWEEEGIYCRCKPDVLAADKRIILDYKSTENAEPETFIRQIGRMSYDLQAELYVRGIKYCTGIEPTFIFLAQEITAPYACSLIALANSYREIGKTKIARAMRIWKSCLKSNQWPAYSNRISYAEPSPWQMIEDLSANSDDSVDGDDE
jgi:PDDEXK-like domain of unknown function (DUF3799)